MAEQATYTKYRAEGKLRLQWELVIDPETRKILTLDQMLTVFRRTIRPEQFTFERSNEDIQNADQILIGRSGEASCQACQGVWHREGRSVPPTWTTLWKIVRTAPFPPRSSGGNWRARMLCWKTGSGNWLRHWTMPRKI